MALVVVRGLRPAGRDDGRGRPAPPTRNGHLTRPTDVAERLRSHPIRLRHPPVAVPNEARPRYFAKALQIAGFSCFWGLCRKAEIGEVGNQEGNSSEGCGPCAVF